MTLATNTPARINKLLNDNEAALDRMSYSLLVAQLMDLKYDALRSHLSKMAVDTPITCIKTSAEMLNHLRELSEEFAGDRRKLLFFYSHRALTNLEHGCPSLGDDAQRYAGQSVYNKTTKSVRYYPRCGKFDKGGEASSSAARSDPQCSHPDPSTQTE